MATAGVLETVCRMAERDSRWITGKTELTDYFLFAGRFVLVGEVSCVAGLIGL
jgi:hypothetical protein